MTDPTLRSGARAWRADLLRFAMLLAIIALINYGPESKVGIWLGAVAGVVYVYVSEWAAKRWRR